MTLSAHQLSFVRDDRPLFQGIEFELRPGGVLQVEGPNGSGKTTLLRVLCALARPSGGEVCWEGRSIVRQRPEYAAALGYLGHRAGLKEGLTPRENLRACTALAGGAGAEEIEEALGVVGLGHLDEEQPCRALSAGQQRRVALARLLLSKARLWVLDEPFTALDKAGRRLVEQLIVRHVTAGGLTVTTTHHGLDLSGCAVQALRLG